MFLWPAHHNLQPSGQFPRKAGSDRKEAQSGVSIEGYTPSIHASAATTQQFHEESFRSKVKMCKLLVGLPALEHIVQGNLPAVFRAPESGSSGTQRKQENCPCKSHRSLRVQGRSQVLTMTYESSCGVSSLPVSQLMVQTPSLTVLFPFTFLTQPPTLASLLFLNYQACCYLRTFAIAVPSACYSLPWLIDLC